MHAIPNLLKPCICGQGQLKLSSKVVELNLLELWCQCECHRLAKVLKRCAVSPLLLGQQPMLVTLIPLSQSGEKPV